MTERLYIRKFYGEYWEWKKREDWNENFDFIRKIFIILSHIESMIYFQTLQFERIS